MKTVLNNQQIRISTHTPARGVTFSMTIHFNNKWHFYSHAREGRDHPNPLPRLRKQISTHTPARGVTNDCLRGVHRTGISTHTPARGVTGVARGKTKAEVNFYSHAREGRDRRNRKMDTKYLNFYSHAREGRDMEKHGKKKLKKKFLLTRPRGA